jgi:hypothetical protein
MKISDMIPRKFLTQSDFEQDLIVTVSKVEKRNVARADDPPEVKWLVHFKEFDRPMILNNTNIHLLAKACKSDESDTWVGKEVVAYTDPNVSFGAKVTGGLRIREYRETPATPSQRSA